jgi:hypothetical protein
MISNNKWNSCPINDPMRRFISLGKPIQTSGSNFYPLMKFHCVRPVQKTKTVWHYLLGLAIVGLAFSGMSMGLAFRKPLLDESVSCLAAIALFIVDDLFCLGSLLPFELYIVFLPFLDWVLYKDKPNFHKDQTSRNWMEYNYLGMAPKDRPYECTLDPGDVIYFPNMVSAYKRTCTCTCTCSGRLTFCLSNLTMMVVCASTQWWHATINLDPYTAFVSTFTQEHLFVRDQFHE